ncbi:hypothetical protein BC829DRAFT_446229 [Chytridium lagenaria]|nr:hypothetical protein BC829DRAFT_446229 [Chytridium lagenaria]
MAERRTTEIKGFERFVSMSEGCMWIAHALRITAPSQVVISNIVPAFRGVFNKHPRMRARMSKEKNEPFIAVIPPGDMTDEDVKPLVTVVEGKDGEDLISGIQPIIQETCSKPVNRTTDSPYKLTVYVGEKSETGLMDKLKLGFLASNVILDQEELPLRPSLFDQQWPNTLFNRIITPLIISVTAPILRAEVKNHTPVLPIRQDQKPFKLPLPLNLTQLHLFTGHPDNLVAGLKRCKEEKVTLHGAVLACVLMSFEKAKGVTPKGKRFKMKVDSDFNMRNRVKKPFPEASVGFNVGIVNLQKLDTKGVDFNEKFWDVARCVKKQMTTEITSFNTVAAPLYMNHKLNSSIKKVEVEVPHSLLGDVNISNLGRYPFETVHTLPRGEIRVEGLHFSNSIPNMGPGVDLVCIKCGTVGLCVFDEVCGRGREEGF